jgi:hypothetical protein
MGGLCFLMCGFSPPLTFHRNHKARMNLTSVILGLALASEQALSITLSGPDGSASMQFPWLRVPQWCLSTVSQSSSTVQGDQTCFSLLKTISEGRQFEWVACWDAVQIKRCYCRVFFLKLLSTLSVMKRVQVTREFPSCNVQAGDFNTSSQTRSMLLFLFSF